MTGLPGSAPLSSRQTSPPLPGWDRSGSPYHAGEQALQVRAGARELAERMGRRVIRTFLPEQHRDFFAELPFVILGSLDAAGRPWASVVCGEPGFVRSPDPRSLRIGGRPLPGDPLRANLRKGAAVGLLGIQPETRRRNRANGRVSAVGDEGFTLAVDQSFGNCPQYIQARSPRPAIGIAGEPPRRTPSPERSILSAEAAELVRGADTFFIASASPGAGGRNPVEGADVSHRGGRPGFVDLRQEEAATLLVVPDFAGNSAFATFGNLLLDPRAGLLFVNFATGDLLMLTGEAEVVWDGPEVRAFPGAERLLFFRVSEGLFMPQALPLRWSEPQPAPQIAGTGTWADAARAEAWRPLVVSRVEEESATVRSLYLEPPGGQSVAPHLPGQFLPVSVDLPGEPRPLRRSYTISCAPGGRRYRLTVKREQTTPGRASVSNWLHDQMQPGALIRTLPPRGDFVLDPDSCRPVVFLSAGIGITPMIAMLDHLTGGAEGPQRLLERPVVFIHAARHGGEQVFADHLRALAGRHPTLTLHVRYSRPRPQDRLGRDHDSVGHLDEALLRTLLPREESDVYLCGPPGFMPTAHGLLTGLGVAERRIHAEAFGPARLDRRVALAPAAGELPLAMAEADVVFRRAGLRLRWRSSTGSLLDLAEAAGIDAPWSCRSGACGSCAARLFEGAVAYPSEPAARCGENEVLVCSAVPASREVVLDL